MLRLFLAVASVVGLASLSLADDPKKLSDEEITKLMVGKWEHTSRFNTTKIRTVEEFNKDGTLVRMDTINDSQNIYTKATWESAVSRLIAGVAETKGLSEASIRNFTHSYVAAYDAAWERFLLNTPVRPAAGGAVKDSPYPALLRLAAGETK